MPGAVVARMNASPRFIPELIAALTGLLVEVRDARGHPATCPRRRASPRTDALPRPVLRGSLRRAGCDGCDARAPGATPSGAAGCGSPYRRCCLRQASRSSTSCRGGRTPSPCSRPSGRRYLPPRAASFGAVPAGGSGRRPRRACGSRPGWHTVSSRTQRESRSSPRPASPPPRPQHSSHRRGRSASGSSPSRRSTSYSSGGRRCGRGDEHAPESPPPRCRQVAAELQQATSAAP